ncbi:MAG: substrate-binding domain-containing protein [Bryobacterales bacterium]
MKSTPNDERYLVDAVTRACDLLRAFHNESERLPLRDLAARTGLTPSRAFRLLYTLERSGMVEKVDSTRYRTRVKRLDRPAYAIGFAGQTTKSPFAVEVADGLRRTAEARRIRLIELDNRWNANAAVRNAQELIRQKVDLAIEFQTFANVAPQVASRFHEAGIPLVAIDIPHPGATYFGADNYRAGMIAGRALGRWAKDEWDGRVERVVLLEIRAAGAMVDARLEGVLAGIREVLPELPSSAVERPDSGGEFQGGLSAMRRSLRRMGRVLVGAGNDPAALGALQAITEARAGDRAVVASQGASAEGRRELRRSGSRLIGSVGYFPERYGEQLLDLAEKILEGRAAPPAVFVRHELITKKNVDEYYANDALLYGGQAVSAAS